MPAPMSALRAACLPLEVLVRAPMAAPPSAPKIAPRVAWLVFCSPV